MLANGGWDLIQRLTLILLTWRMWRVPTNASKWRMGFDSAFKGLMDFKRLRTVLNCSETDRSREYPQSVQTVSRLGFEPVILCIETQILTIPKPHLPRTVLSIHYATLVTYLAVTSESRVAFLFQPRQPPVGLSLVTVEVQRSHSDTPHSVGLL